MKIVVNLSPYEDLTDDILFIAPSLKRHLPIICS